ncbi:methyl-accepting chemotaxis protein [Butyrivibrio sp. AE3006]|uniref:methyl-accepting chemotaxis protein n=1 Tax=Butyrivibrio sp. AE3006 TaxID=1280673 RepID=UPI0003F94E4B|nr:HAMP domain-containing methyl-accepting chemotaxis protein [Butyrivibrio sp. AE3006]
MSVINLVRVDEKKIHDLSVKEKFDSTFKQIIIMFCTTAAILAITILAALISVRTIYRKYYTMNTYQAEIRIDVQALSKAFLWALSSPDDAIRQEQLGKAMEKFAEFDANLANLETVLDDTSALTAVSNDLKIVQQNGKTLGDMFTNGSTSEEIFYYFNDTLYPSIDAAVQDFKSVSSGSKEAAASAYRAALIMGIVLSTLSIIIVIMVMIYIVDVKKKLSKSILEPVEEISKAADDMSRGNLNINIDYTSGDELGRLAKDLNESTSITERIVADIRETLRIVADGDFTQGTLHPELYKEDFAPIKEALNNITESLSDTLSRVKDSSNHVSEGASGMSRGATDLAEGATDQAAAVEELTASVNTVTEQTKLMAETAEKSRKMAEKVREDADASARKMHLVTDAMVRITEASNEIEQVTNSIESIAKQTQLLALNASIEAARAGESGKGFAVVAEEISTLASQSSEAAKNTHQLIQDTMEEIRNGNDVVGETTDALQQMQASVEEITGMIMETGEMAQNQATSMEEINEGIDQISSVVQSNSETAQESSNVSQTLTEQSEDLNRMINQFKLR